MLLYELRLCDVTFEFSVLILHKTFVIYTLILPFLRMAPKEIIFEFGRDVIKIER